MIVVSTQMLFGYKHPEGINLYQILSVFTSNVPATPLQVWAHPINSYIVVNSTEVLLSHKKCFGCEKFQQMSNVNLSSTLS